MLRRMRWVCGLGLCVVVVAGCSGREPPCPSGTVQCGVACVDVSSDRTSCGGCGVACAGGEVCSDGRCSLECGAGLLRCGDACLDVTSDPANCGGCGETCAAGEACRAGECGTTCAPGESLCDGRCWDTQTTESHCGGCGIRCDELLSCRGGRCLDCEPPLNARCGGHCTNTDSDPFHCGGCDRVCPSPAGGTALCEAGECTLWCGPGLTECDGTCVDTVTDLAHCGGCGRGCGVDETCAASACVPDCGAGLALCGGGCVETATDPAHCGGCDRPCGATEICSVGGCTTELPPRPIAPLSTARVTSQRPTFRWELRGGADGARVEICADPACATVELRFDATGTSARPGSALAAGVHFWRVTGLRGTVPTATGPLWEVVVGPRSAEVDSSGGTLADIDGDGRDDLASCAMRAADGAGQVNLYGGADLEDRGAATMSLRDAGTARNYGASVALGDLDRDGHADLAIGALRRGEEAVVRIHRGRTEMLETSPSATLQNPDGADFSFGMRLLGGGDVNGDGFGDLVVLSNDLAPTGRVHVYHGRAGGIPSDAMPDRTLDAPEGTGSRYGLALAGAADVNGDGYADLAVGTEGGASGPRVHVYFGGASGLPPTPSVTVIAPESGATRYGTALALADLDADGFADLVVGASGAAEGAGRAYLYRGGPSGPALAPTSTFAIEASRELGATLNAAGDLDGDGYHDLVVGEPTGLVGAEPSTGRVHVYLGRAGGLPASPTPSVTVNGPDRRYGYFGRDLAALDYDGDGRSDVAIGGYWAVATGGGGTPPSPPMPGTGRVYVYAGTTGGLFADAPSATVHGPEIGSWFGWVLAGAF